MEKRWRTLPFDDQEVTALQKSLTINYAICTILVQRGIKTFEQAKQFFRPSIEAFHDPYLLKDMDKAVERIARAISHGEKILVYGDYDVDGTSSVACMYQFLVSLHPLVDFYLPHRYREGYGVSRAGVDFAIENNFKLIVSLDCGIKSIELVKHAQIHGVDFVICDHHTPDDHLPEAVAILNPKQRDCQYPFKELCGCGVGLKLIQALCRHYQLPDQTWHQYLDLAATAIAADIVPINGENRTISFFGLQKINENPSVGIQALINLSQAQKPLNVSSLVFVIAPRINAAGRMDDARKAVELFIEQDEAKANELAAQLHSDNTDRKEADLNITEEAVTMAEDSLRFGRKTTVLYQPHWHKGVVGIVASRLVDRYYRPTIILTQSGDKISGSARSVLGFNIYDAIHHCRHLLENYGGHFYAAGLTMHQENLAAFKSAFEEVVSNTITDEMLTPEITIDTVVRFVDITPTFYNIICQMEPFGPDNMRPVFMARRVYETGLSRIVKNEHIKFSLKQDSAVLTGIGFGMAEKFNLLKPNEPLDVVFTVEMNEWQQSRKIQLKVIDIRSSFNSYFE